MPPPEDYDVSKITKNLKNTKMLFFAGTNDAFTTKKDLPRLEALIPEENLTTLWLDDYNHCDYLWGYGIEEDVNVPVIRFLR